ncbi:MAG: hypothetical protein WBM26_14225, partial [Polyangiales bacterium]
ICFAVGQDLQAVVPISSLPQADSLPPLLFVEPNDEVLTALLHVIQRNSAGSTLSGIANYDVAKWFE